MELMSHKNQSKFTKNKVIKHSKIYKTIKELRIQNNTKIQFKILEYHNICKNLLSTIKTYNLNKYHKIC